ncbi:MAG: biopolymer transporter ExbD [Bacteroidota bacterium]|nr:biopolymer transporter ExbD [Bacteroidota bacterium]
MPKVKIPRKSTLVDMTAMCDVAFLLLTFFMLTTQFKSDDPVVVSLPSSISEIKMPDVNIVTVTIDKSGKVFFGMEGKYNREKLIDKIAENKNITITPEQKRIFSLLSSFGVPISKLPEFLDLSQEERNKPGYQTGIPVDSTNNELKEWLKFAKIVVYETDRSLYVSQLFAIKGDGSAAYPLVKKVMNTFQDKTLQINKFRLVTNLEAAPPVQK